MKVAIIGLGKVGSAIAYSMIFAPSVASVRLVEQDTDKLQGEMIDLVQASCVVRKKNIFKGCKAEDIEKDYLVFITAGIGREYQVNKKIVGDILKKLHVPKQNIRIVTNPSGEMAKHFGTREIGELHRMFGDCQQIVKLKGYTNWGIAAECWYEAENVYKQA
jgi:malate/lactate dehydrogenase